MDEFYHEWRIHIDNREGGGVLVFAPKSKYGTRIVADTHEERLQRAVAYIDSQIAPMVALTKASAEEEARNAGLEFSPEEPRVGL